MDLLIDCKPQGNWGARAVALVGMLGTRYHLSQRKTCHLLDQVMGLNFSVGAISQAQGKVASALEVPVAQACHSVKTAPGAMEG